MERMIADKIRNGWCLLIPRDYDVLDAFLAGVFLEDDGFDDHVITIETYAPTTMMPAFLMKKSLELQFWLGYIEIENFDNIICINLEQTRENDIEAIVKCHGGDLETAIDALIPRFLGTI